MGESSGKVEENHWHEGLEVGMRRDQRTEKAWVVGQRELGVQGWGVGRPERDPGSWCPAQHWFRRGPLADLVSSVCTPGALLHIPGFLPIYLGIPEQQVDNNFLAPTAGK